MTTAFDAIQLGDLQLANRIAMSPMTRSRAYGPGATVTDLTATYYAQRASAGLIVSEGAVIGQGYPDTPGRRLRLGSAQRDRRRVRRGRNPRRQRVPHPPVPGAQCQYPLRSRSRHGGQRSDRWGSTDYLVSAQRQRIIDDRDHLREAIDEAN